MDYQKEIDSWCKVSSDPTMNQMTTPKESEGMKKTCNKCRVSSWEKGVYTCELGYDINITAGTPNEECPKPLTISQYFNAKHKIYTK